MSFVWTAWQSAHVVHGDPKKKKALKTDCTEVTELTGSWLRLLWHTRVHYILCIRFRKAPDTLKSILTLKFLTVCVGSGHDFLLQDAAPAQAVVLFIQIRKTRFQRKTHQEMRKLCVFRCIKLAAHDVTVCCSTRSGWKMLDDTRMLDAYI